MSAELNNERYNYKWIVLLSASVCNAFSFGLLFSVGVWYKEWVNYFDNQASLISVASVLPSVVASLSGLVYGILMEKLGIRLCGFIGGVLVALGMATSRFVKTVLQLCVTFGILTGFGAGMCNFAASGIINDYFTKKRMFAEGVFGGGLNAGSFILSFLQQYLVNIYTWRGAILIVGGVCFHNSLCAMFFISSNTIANNPLNLWKSSKCEQTDIDDKERKTIADNKAVNEDIQDLEFQTDATSTTVSFKSGQMSERSGYVRRSLSLFGNPVFILIAVVHFFACLGMLIPYVHLVERAKKEGIDVSTAVWLLSVIGLAGIVGRPLTGMICSYFHFHPLRSYCILQVTSSICLFVMSFTSNVFGLFICAGIFGLVSNGYGFIKASAGFMLGVQHFADAYSWMLVLEGIGVLLGPAFAGFLYDVTKSYKWSFCFSGSLILIAASLCLLKSPAERYNRKKKEHDTKTIPKKQNKSAIATNSV